MTSPYANGRPSLPPLEVAAAAGQGLRLRRARRHRGPAARLHARGRWTSSTAALAKASSPRAAGRAALQALAAATGWKGGALWQPRDEGDFACAETWSAYMSGLEAWETMAWRAHLEDGLVPAAAGSGEAHWADTEEMLACPRSRSAAWAELGTLATVPVVHPDGRVVRGARAGPQDPRRRPTPSCSRRCAASPSASPSASRRSRPSSPRHRPLLGHGPAPARPQHAQHVAAEHLVGILVAVALAQQRVEARRGRPPTRARRASA